MRVSNRVLLAVAIILLDFIVFFVPLTAFFLAYIVLYNPPWFREFLNSLNGEQNRPE